MTGNWDMNTREHHAKGSAVASETVVLAHKVDGDTTESKTDFQIY